mmetsp:Transcript_8483/g.11441  ORF Transcript_8483/g.11441 Transcript_8483/m.11441 type:complete len:100 (+) Transcript_8483:58-357(+)
MASEEETDLHEKFHMCPLVLEILRQIEAGEEREAKQTITKLKSHLVDCRQTVDEILSHDTTPREQDLELEQIQQELEVQRERIDNYSSMINRLKIPPPS